VFSKFLMLRYPKTEVQKPIVCYLAKDFDLTFNILKASVLPRKKGIMVLELSGLCVPDCPTRAMNFRPTTSGFFR
jgi:hypothetical protein